MIRINKSNLLLRRNPLSSKKLKVLKGLMSSKKLKGSTGSISSGDTDEASKKSKGSISSGDTDDDSLSSSAFTTEDHLLQSSKKANGSKGSMGSIPNGDTDEASKKSKGSISSGDIDEGSLPSLASIIEDNLSAVSDASESIFFRSYETDDLTDATSASNNDGYAKRFDDTFRNSLGHESSVFSVAVSFAESYSTEFTSNLSTDVSFDAKENDESKVELVEPIISRRTISLPPVMEGSKRRKPAGVIRLVRSMSFPKEYKTIEEEITESPPYILSAKDLQLTHRIKKCVNSIDGVVSEEDEDLEVYVSCAEWCGWRDASSVINGW